MKRIINEGIIKFFSGVFMKFLLAIFLIGILTKPGHTEGFGEKHIAFSHPGGFYDDVFELSIIVNPGLQVYYTLDGTTPTILSHLYSGPILLSIEQQSPVNISQFQLSPSHLHSPPSIENVQKAIIIRAVILNSTGASLSKVITHTYFIRSLGAIFPEMPVISIAADHFELFDEETGIFVPGVHWDSNNPDWTGNYYQTGENWERKVYFEFFAKRGPATLQQFIGLRTHGGNARRFTQKGMRLYSHDDYGTDRFYHPFFPEKNISSYKRLVLKPISSSWSNAGVEDYLADHMALGLNLEVPAIAPVNVFLNGEYWGIYFLQERFDDHYFADNFDVNRDNIDLIENWAGVISEGENENFLALYDYIEQNNLQDSLVYRHVEEWIDIDNFIEYQIFEIFIANYDWPANNMKCWRVRPDGKWRWVFFDGDAALKNVNDDMFDHALDESNQGWPTNEQTTLFFRRLMENEEFSKKFLNQFEILLNFNLSPEVTIPVYNKGKSLIKNEIPNQIKRFSYPDSFEAWEEATLLCQSFLTLRPCIILTQVKKEYDIDFNIPGCKHNRTDFKDVIVYPNPNNGTFFIEFESNKNDIAHIILSNLIGQPLFFHEFPALVGLNKVEFSELSLSPGIWLVAIKTSDRNFTSKIYVLPK